MLYFINPLLQVGSGSNEKSKESGWPKINGFDSSSLPKNASYLEVLRVSRGFERSFSFMHSLKRYTITFILTIPFMYYLKDYAYWPQEGDVIFMLI